MPRIDVRDVPPAQRRPRIRTAFDEMGSGETLELVTDHYQTHRHIDMGMYGIFRVDPKGYEPADKEHFITVKDWDSRLNRKMAGEDVEYSPARGTPTCSRSTGRPRRARSTPRTGRP